MSRGLRLHAPGVAAHVMSRGNGQQCIFTDSVDYERYLELLGRALARFGVDCHAFCLVWNHTHLLVTPWQFALPRMMQQLNSHYCQWFNHRHGRVGHVLQGRYRCKLIDDGSYFLNAVRYIALNPVAAQKVHHPADWPWSSYRAMIGLDSTRPYLRPERIWQMVDAADECEGIARVKALVECGGHPDELWGPLIVGSRAFARQLAPLVAPHCDNGDFTYADRFAARPALDAILAGAAAGVELEDRVYTAFVRYAYTLKEIGVTLQLHPSTAWTWVQRSKLRR